MTVYLALISRKEAEHLSEKNKAERKYELNVSPSLTAPRQFVAQLRQPDQLYQPRQRRARPDPSAPVANAAQCSERALPPGAEPLCCTAGWKQAIPEGGPPAPGIRPYLQEEAISDLSSHSHRKMYGFPFRHGEKLVVFSSLFSIHTQSAFCTEVLGLVIYQLVDLSKQKDLPTSYKNSLNWK